MATATIVMDRPEQQDPDHAVLDHLERHLQEGLALKRWYEQSGRAGRLSTFDLVHTFNRPDRSHGFFGVADLGSRTLPVMGVVDEVFYDRPKAPPEHQAAANRWIRDQIREFVLRYFLRISDFRRPQTVPEPSPGLLAELLSPISLRPKEEVERDGMGFSQAFYRKSSTNVVGEFPKDRQSEVVDLREIGSEYDWVALRLQVYQFNVTVKPLGTTAPQFMMPLKEESYLVVTPDFITNADDPEPGVLGEYGFGYAFVRNPKRGPFAYGPGEFEVAFQTINFRVLETGEVWVRMTFCSDQPQKILNLTLDPVDWSFTLADLMSFGQASRVLAPFKSLLQQMPFRDFNLDPTVPTLDWMNTLTAGQAAQQLAMSKEELYKGFLRRHSIQHYQTVLGSLRTWRQVPDWNDKNAIPMWAEKGWSS